MHSSGSMIKHPPEFVDAVDRADVDARAIFDVDARLGDDVRHGGECIDRAQSRRCGQLGDDLGHSLDQRGLHDHLVEAGRVRTLEPRLVGVIREAEDRNVGPGVHDFLGLDASDVHDHEIRRMDAVGRDQAMPVQQGFELPPEEQIDPCEQDGRHELEFIQSRGGSASPSPLRHDRGRASKIRLM